MSIPEGWKLVPAHWTEEIAEAMADAFSANCSKEVIDNWLHLRPMYEAALAAVPTQPVPEWSDSDLPLPEDKEIEATHPLVTGRFDLDQEAMRLVSAKHSKFALVALVRWLLTKAETPPEKKDEPVAYQIWHPEFPIWANCSKGSAERLVATDDVYKVRCLYTRPDNSELRKAAEEALGAIEQVYDITDCFIHESLYLPMINLRYALEGK